MTDSIWYWTKNRKRCHFPMYPPPGRTGNCNKCGECCAGCQYLAGNLCSIWSDLIDTYKGCLIFPEKAEEIANCPSCGYKFGGAK